MLERLPKTNCAKFAKIHGECVVCKETQRFFMNMIVITLMWLTRKVALKIAKYGVVGSFLK